MLTANLTSKNGLKKAAAMTSSLSLRYQTVAKTYNNVHDYKVIQ